MTKRDNRKKYIFAALIAAPLSFGLPLGLHSGFLPAYSFGLLSESSPLSPVIFPAAAYAAAPTEPTDAFIGGEPEDEPEEPDEDYGENTGLFASIKNFVVGLVVPKDDFFKSEYDKLDEKLKAKIPYMVYIETIGRLKDVTDYYETFALTYSAPYETVKFIFTVYGALSVCPGSGKQCRWFTISTPFAAVTATELLLRQTSFTRGKTSRLTIGG